jgi:hypothetical protein
MASAKITMSELPLRAQRLSDGDIANVFGGCIGVYKCKCSKDSDCCQNYGRGTYCAGSYPATCFGECWPKS